ncbi:MAG TPA: hypothetical protein VMV94_18200 [Phycisphaerae bacterium]|nr:hypothetical protein [Phycisphaerae bacterium]
MNPNETLNFDSLETNSSMFEKVPPGLRSKIDRALVDRSPPTYKGVFEQFKLAELGVSYHAFYRYARRVRSQASMFHLASLALPDDTTLHTAVPRLLAQQIVETLLYEEASPEHIQRLVNAYRNAVRCLVDLRRSGVFLPPPPGNSTTPPGGSEPGLDSMMAVFNKLARHELRAERAAAATTISKLKTHTPASPPTSASGQPASQARASVTTAASPIGLAPQASPSARTPRVPATVISRNTQPQSPAGTEVPTASKPAAVSKKGPFPRLPRRRLPPPAMPGRPIVRSSRPPHDRRQRRHRRFVTGRSRCIMKPWGWLRRAPASIRIDLTPIRKEWETS